MARKEVGLEVRSKTKYMVMSRDQNAGRNHNMKIDNRSFGMTEEFKYFGTNLNRAKFYSGRNKESTEVKECLLTFSAESFVFQLPSKNLKIKIYRTIIVLDVLYVCKTWPLSLREKRRLRLFENWVLRRIFGPRRDKLTGEWRKLSNEEFNDLDSSPNNVQVIKSRILRWAGHVARMERGEAYTAFWWGNLRERDHL